MSKVAASRWDEIIVQLRHLGILSSCDGPLIALHAETFARCVEIRKVISRDGLMLGKVKHPLLQTLLQAESEQRHQLRSLCLVTQGIRGVMEKPDEGPDSWQSLIKIAKPERA